MYYDKNFRLADQTFILLPNAICIITFTLATNKESLDEIKKSNYFFDFFNFFSVIVLSYYFCNHLTIFHADYARDLNLQKNYTDVLIYIICDYVILFGMLFLAKGIKYFYSKNRRTSKFIWTMTSRLIFLVLIYIAFYANYNKTLNNFLYDKFMENVPQPHNAIIYNIIPEKAEMRLHIIISTLMYLIL